MSDEVIVQREGAPADDPAHGARIETGSFGPWETNAYLVWDGRSTDALVLDPGMGAAAPLIERAEAPTGCASTSSRTRTGTSITSSTTPR